jgi:hypothetical protein
MVVDIVMEVSEGVDAGHAQQPLCVADMFGGD